MAENLSSFARGRTFRERVGARESLHYRNCDGKRPDCAYVWGENLSDARARRGRGHRRSDDGALSARGGHRRRRLRGRARHEGTRRRHQSSAARRARIERAGSAVRARLHGDRDARARLLHEARQTDLARAARPERRLPLATVFNPSRPIADDSRARRRGASGRVCHSHRPPPHPFRAGRHGRDGPFRRSRKRSSRRQRPGRCVDRRRRHPLQGTRGALPGRGAAAIHRNHHVARHHRTGTLPRWADDGHRRQLAHQGGGLSHLAGRQLHAAGP